MFFNGNLESSHVNGWADVWRNGRIDLNGNDTLSTLAYSSLYYIMSSLPLGPTPDFVGLSPGDLAHGEGHQVLSCCYTNINFIYMFNIKNNRECTKIIMIFNVFNISSKFNFNFVLKVHVHAGNYCFAECYLNIKSTVLMKRKVK